jgi:two-component system, cell cycle response regulator DivK
MQAYESGHARRPAAATRKQRKAPAPARRARPAVVLLEDDDMMRVVSAEVLRAAGFEVLECPTLLEGFAALEKRIPDVVVLDRDLPDGNGLDLARWVRRRASLAGVRVIGFSGRKSAQDVEAALDAGCDAFVGKPCAPATLVAEIRRSSARP